MDMQRLAHLQARAVRLIPPRVRPHVFLLATAARRWIDEGGPQLGASIAFYTMFAMAPLLVIAIAVAGAVFGVEAARGEIVGQIEDVVGTQAAQTLEALISSAWRHPDGTMAGVIGLITLLVGATGVFTELRRAFNAIHHIQPPHSAVLAFLRARLTGLALVLGFGFLSIASLLISALLQGFNDVLAREGLDAILNAFNMIVSTTVMTLAFAGLLRWLPHRPPRWSSVWLGAITCVALFSVGKYAITMYLSHASVASSYGAAGSFVVVMLWVYYSAQLLLFGGAVSACWDEYKRRSSMHAVEVQAEPPQMDEQPRRWMSY